MAVADPTVHYVQDGDAPVLVGSGSATLSCACGRTLIGSYDPAQFLAVGIRCGGCGEVTVTPELPTGRMPPGRYIVAEQAPDPHAIAASVAEGVAVVAKAEFERIITLYRPRTPPSTIYTFDDALLTAAEASFERVTGGPLPQTSAEFADGLAQHALAWSIMHLRERVRIGTWACLETPASSIACVTVAGFQHFVATWSYHPLFPAMVAAAADRGFSSHGLALFAAAHCLIMQRNNVGFPAPDGMPDRLTQARLATGPSQSIAVLTHVFDRFEVPWGRAWNADSLRAAVQEAIESEQVRINPRNPGLLLLSPGSAMAGFDEALFRELQAVMQAVGRRHRGLMAAAPMLLRQMPGPQRQAIQFGYGLFPVKNRHYRGEGGLA